MAGMEGDATFVRRTILYISVHMWYLNSMSSLHSLRPGYFSYKLCGQPAELCGVLQSSFICRASLKKEIVQG